MRKFILMALAALGLAIAAPSTGSAAPAISHEALQAAIDATSNVETVAHCRRTSYYGCRYYRVRYYRPRYRVYRVYRYRRWHRW